MKNVAKMLSISRNLPSIEAEEKLRTDWNFIYETDETRSFKKIEFLDISTRNYFLFRDKIIVIIYGKK